MVLERKTCHEHQTDDIHVIGPFGSDTTVTDVFAQTIRLAAIGRGILHM